MKNPYRQCRRRNEAIDKDFDGETMDEALDKGSGSKGPRSALKRAGGTR